MSGDVLTDCIVKSRVLVVGAGGIGCEVLKNLVLSGFEDIVILDLDTIDVSNLNRQFLFRKEHINESKAAIARKTALEFNPNVRIEAFHTMIQDEMFSYAYMSQFDVVLSALDNPQARVYLNRLCFTAGVSLIECGTQGYAGQTYAVVHGVTECKECQPQSNQKTYPVCTLRNTPTEPVHCITWAKHVYAVLFGVKDEKNDMTSSIEEPLESICAASSNTFGSKTDGGNDSVVGVEDIVTSEETRQVQENQTLKLNCTSPAQEFARKVFLRYFTNELYAQRTIKTRWVGRTAPDTLLLSSYVNTPKTVFSSVAARTHKVQTISVYVDLLQTGLETIYNTQLSSFGSLEFSKDDPLSCEIVCCMSILRMLAYHIPALSEFETLGVAANIVHAVATTNAIGAGYSVIEAIKIIEAKYTKQEYKTIFITNRFPRMVDGTAMEGPSSTCFCGLPQFQIYTNLEHTTLQTLYDTVDEHLKTTDVQFLPLLNKTIQGSVYDMEDDNPAALESNLAQLKFKNRDCIQAIDDSDAKCILQLLSLDNVPTSHENRLFASEEMQIFGPLSLFAENIEKAKQAKILQESQLLQQYDEKQLKQAQNGPIHLESDTEEDAKTQAAATTTDEQHMEDDIIEL